MLSSFARFMLALTSLSPIAITWVIADYSQHNFNKNQVIVLASAFILAFATFTILHLARKSLTKISFSAQTIKSVDNEVIAYIVTYLFPLLAPAANISLISQGFVLLLLAYVLSTAHAFTFNPVLTFAGYHFYEVQSTSGITYLVLSKNDITDIKKVTKVGRLSKHLMLDLS